MAVLPPTVHPIQPPSGSQIDFGAQIEGIDLENISDEQFTTIRNALYNHHVVVFKNQQKISPKAQYELTKRFDPAADNYGHGKTIDAKRSILHPDLKTVPHQPQVQIIGNGFVESYEGLENFQLRHPHHRTFHKDRIPDDKDYDYTRFYRWHIDAALYDLNPPQVTTLLAVRVPKGRRQTLLYDDGSGETMDVPLGTTAFVSGERMYELLSPAEQEFVRTIPHTPAPQDSAYTPKASNSQQPPSPPIEANKIKTFPMLWKNPVTGKLSLQIHPSAIRKIHLADGSVIDDLERVREIVYKLQRPGISPQYVYAHDWEEGDLVLFNNRGVLHSVVGAFKPEEVRLFRQCNLAASEPPVGP
ncbi:Alpha-ketoglutarate-dependent xanthine dioxygenase xanA [Penicillium cataractarum]|uniref:Alpha-ketoglutarate-dependent xanthine dioxygenase xanA n=1 Tax=Penicillium cataractarum TaxID=2100454 RepID=A0A9W9VTC0_9EURO|nr:Alpha-ketoglutarate-dependent xanthine dioxygenase xanA [Penicillium cataractarum]KAJ5388967.1 Alpha-ketoglutarate-dependent xanthine dioxygenase xanA [Penicillium cataractarum]